MIAVDTNVLIRYLVRDDIAQAECADRFFHDRVSAAEPAWISLIVLAETIWGLLRRYRTPPAVVQTMAERLLAAEQIIVESAEVVRAAVAIGGPGIVDTLIHLSGQAAGCTATVTFDRNLARQPGVELLA